MMRALWIVVGMCTVLAACSTPEPPPVPAPEPEPVVVKPERIKSQPLKHLLGRNLKPIPDKALEVRTKCSFHDVQGGRGSMDLHVVQGEVKRFVADVTIPKHGVCHIDVKHFEQAEILPNVLLVHKDKASGCVVRMWEQEKGITVAYHSCQKMCTGEAFSYLWPILVDAKSGRCV